MNEKLLEQLLLVGFGSIISLMVTFINNISNNNRLKLQYSFEEKKEKKKSIQAHYEELYLQSSKYLNGLNSSFFVYYSLLQNKITYDQANDEIIRELSEAKYDPHKVQMLLRLYFPELLESFEKVMRARDEINELLVQHKLEYRSGRVDGSKYLDSFTAMHDFLDQEIDSYLSAIIANKRVIL
ncbi:hypothetical protein [Leptospira andrefontaineae]|uniref:Uncharacterized protein n=1 Tax=Leptospira andrefontaineae TaxID=2484976 RepID=A0A4R9H6F0_9LEPT|nr:hypothetical protein [Leptospira andrefontaineae]TGK41154.1 hypothetical protein EHO65_06905 [Leptospira andrefontaineae]